MTNTDTQAVLRQQAVDMFLANTPPLATSTIDEFRAGFEKLLANFEPLPEADIKAVDADGVPCFQVAMPGVSADHLVIHFHSGGYVMGSAKGYRNFGCRLSAATGATVLLPEYRLAPEHPYPAPVEDARKVYAWARRTWPASRIVISGDSAGGGLAMATLMALRDDGDTLPAAGVAISPVTDMAGEGASCDTCAATDPLISRAMIVDIGKVYIGDRDPHQTPLASPLWGRHHGLPPLFFAASRSEVLRDDSVRFVEKVRAAGGSAELSLPAADLIHIWTIFPFLDDARASLAEIGGFMRRHLGLV